MSPRLFVIALGIPLLSGCAGSRAPASPEIFDRELESTFRDHDREMARPRTPIAFESGRTASSCAGYLDERTRGEISGDVPNHLIESEYVLCEVLALLRRARPVRGARRPPSFYAQTIAGRLDLRSFRSSLRPRMEDGDQPVMRGLAFLSPATNGFTVVSDTDDWYYSFEVIARADFTDDDSEDWLVLFIDRAKEGTYRDYGVLVVKDVERPGLLRAALQR